MTAPQLVIIADDLTGAADTAGAFASTGLAVVLSLAGLTTPEAEVLALSTDCRDAGSGDVYQRVSATLARARCNGEPRRWFQKIDSAMRGHPGAEIPMIMQAIGCEIAVCAPALPAQGRTVVDGQVVINGHPLHLTTLGEGKPSSSVETILSLPAGMRVVAVNLASLRSQGALDRLIQTGESPTLLIVDAETEDDLLMIARAIVDRPDILPVGSAGLGTAVASKCCLPPRGLTRGNIRASPAPAFCVAGSAHQVCARQVEFARGQGAAVVRPFQIEHRWTSREIDDLRERIRDHLRAGKDTILTTAGFAPSMLDGQVLSEQLAWVAAGPILDGLCGSLLLTGGDIAAAVCTQIDADFIWVRGEVSAAIPWGVLGGGPCAGIPIVTKAGSFGSQSGIAEAMTFLHSAGQSA
ncbi:MAG: four-carbon acid sugar kinase family protein [Thermomicrobiales bacterium]